MYPVPGLRHLMKVAIFHLRKVLSKDFLFIFVKVTRIFSINDFYRLFPYFLIMRRQVKIADIMIALTRKDSQINDPFMFFLIYHI